MFYSYLWHNEGMSKRPFLINLITGVAISSFAITFFSIFFGALSQSFFIFDFIFPLFFFTFFMFIVMMIANVLYLAKNPTSPMMAMQTQGFATLASQAGYTVITLPMNHPSGAQYVIDHPTGKLLVRVLTMQQTFQNEMVQKVSGSLAVLQAKEGWIVSMMAPFKENDQSFARFYNVSLLTMNEAMTMLSTKN